MRDSEVRDSEVKTESFWMKNFRISRPTGSPLEHASYILECDDVLIPPGKVLLVEAPSGFGKTTFLRALAGLEECEGEFGFSDATSRRIDQLPVHQRGLGIVFQDQLLLSHLNAIENVALGLRLRKVPKKEAETRATQELTSIGLASRMHDPIPRLSGGERQRVALLRSLIIEPSLLILDEPFKGLDQQSAEQIKNYLHAQIKKYGLPVIIISHQEESSDIKLVGEMHSHVRRFRLK